MELFLFWPLLGAIIGIAAAQKKGWSIASGAIAGIFLGPLAVLLFAMSGIFSASESQRRKCPHCMEWMSSLATVCPRCQRDVGAAQAAGQATARPQPPPSSGVSGKALVIVLLGVAAAALLAWWLFGRAERQSAAAQGQRLAAVREEYDNAQATSAIARVEATKPPPDLCAETEKQLAAADRQLEQSESALYVNRELLSRALAANTELKRDLVATHERVRRAELGLARAVRELNKLSGVKVPLSEHLVPPG